MNARKIQTALLCSLGMVLLAAIAAPAQLAPSSVPPKGLPPALQNVSFDPQLDAALRLDLKFRDDAGRSVQLGDYFGQKPVILALVYYSCPMLCDQVEQGVVRTLKMVSFAPGKEFSVVFVSFDARETPEMAAEKKKEALERYGHPESAAGWHFLTGEQASVDVLTKASNFRYTFDAHRNLFAHASGILLLTPQGRISRYFFGIDYPPRDVRLGLVEASTGKIGTPVDHLLLYCYQYDPAAAKYSSAVLRLIRIGGVLTILAIVAGILIFRRQESRTGRLKSQGAS